MGCAPAQVPGFAVSTVPTVVVPVIVGRTVTVGASFGAGARTSVGAETTSAFFTVSALSFGSVSGTTATRIVCPTSSWRTA